MADWLPGIGLLSDSSLQGIDEATRNKLQSEATGRFLLGSLLSGRPDIGFQSAIGTANDYAASQARLLDLAEKQRQQQELDAFRRQYMPTPSDAAGRAMAGGGGPTLQAAEAQKTILNTPLDIDSALRSTLGMSGNAAQPRIVENLKAMQTQFRPETGERVTPGGRTVETIPLSDKSGMQRVYDPTTKQWTFSAGVGAPQAISQLTAAEKGAAAQFDFEPVKMPDGTTVYKSKSSMAKDENMLQRASGDVAALQREISLTKPTETGRLAILNQELTKAQEQFKAAGGVAGVKELTPAQTSRLGSWEQVQKDAYKGWKLASDRSGTLQSLQNIMNRPDFDTNAFSNYKSQITGILNAAGIANEQQKQFLTNSTGFRQGVNTIAAQNLADLSGSTSNFDLQFSQGRFASLTDPKEANRYAIDLLAASDDKKKEFYNFVQDNPSADVIKKWQQSDKGSVSVFEDARLRKYLPQAPVVSGPYKGQTAYTLPNGIVKVFPK